MRVRDVMLAAVVVVIGACTPTPGAVDAGFVLDVPAALPQPPIPADNPITAEKIELGRHFFYDKRLSINGTLSCGGCHVQSKGFTDGKPVAQGATGDHTPRNAMTLTNVAYAPVLTWENPSQGSLEQQMHVPMFGQHPVELGLTGIDQAVFATLSADPLYQRLVGAAFPGTHVVTLDVIQQSIASFERTLLSGNSPVDRFLSGGDTTALSSDAKRGLSLFFSEKCECYHCHGGFAYTDAARAASEPFPAVLPYHNNGLYNVDGNGAYPASDLGLFALTQKPADMGKFKAPTLRNIAVTGPYMHDGSLATLDAVLDHYAHGGQLIASGPNAGDGSKNPHKDPLIKGFTLSDDERRALLAFFQALTDDTFLHDPRFADPFPATDAGVVDAGIVDAGVVDAGIVDGGGTP
jgi:cytochrome c peroxidase